ncbi:MAG: hypothetical protein ACRD4B_00400, partial [Acidobacteriota bacterium]
YELPKENTVSASPAMSLTRNYPKGANIAYILIGLQLKLCDGATLPSSNLMNSNKLLRNT